jgi:hypothetical protein
MNIKKGPFRKCPLLGPFSEGRKLYYSYDLNRHLCKKNRCVLAHLPERKKVELFLKQAKSSSV